MAVCRRLLFITERFAPDLGGVSRSATRTVAALARLGIDVEVLSWSRSLPAGERDTREMPREALSGRVVVHRMGLFANLDYSLQHTMTLLESLHRSVPFDGVWGHYLSTAGFLSVLFANTVGIPATVSARGNDVDLLTFPPGDFARLTWTLARAHSVTAVSADLERKIRVLVPGAQRVQIVRNSVDVDLFRPADAEDSLKSSLGILSNEMVLGFSGELRHKKGIRPMLAAFREVRRVRPVCLLVIGEVRARDQAVLTSFAAEDPDAHTRLIVTGHLENQQDIVRHLRLCDLFLQPSYWDGLPNSVLEAMACERVVLASDAGGIPEAIEHGRSGFLLPRLELTHLGEAILELMAISARQRQQIGLAARRRVEEHFSATREANALKQALDDLWSTDGSIELPVSIKQVLI
ncbi:MAG: glycosyltransferase [Schlesneria sp.]